MEECVITSTARNAMLAALRKEPRLAELFVTYLVTRSNGIEEDLIDSYSIRARSGSHAFCFCSPISAKWKANTNRCFDQSSNLGGDDRNDPIPRELFPEQISQAGLDQLQRKDRGASFVIERSAI
jgi:hypothetical protein